MRGETGRAGAGRVLGEVRDLLRLTVVDHFEVGAIQSRYRCTMPVRHDDVEAREAHLQGVEKRRRHLGRRSIDGRKQHQGEKDKHASLHDRPPEHYRASTVNSCRLDCRESSSTTPTAMRAVPGAMTSVVT